MVGIGSEAELNRFPITKRTRFVSPPSCHISGLFRSCVLVVTGFVMTDQNLDDFYDSVRRYHSQRSKGYAHEATGALGRSFYYGPQKSRRRRSFLMPVLFALTAAFLLKATIFYSVGPANYQDRLSRLEAGEGFDKFGAWLMQSEPVTEFLAKKIGQGVHALKS